jgi:DNA polymerase III delta prime subunit
MGAGMEVDEAFSLISRAIDEGRAAHGYLVCGDIDGGCKELCERILDKLFPDAKSQLKSQSHPDVAYIEPEGAKRIITVKSMHEQILEPMASTSFSGGWKVGVIIGADRMEAPSANAFLKSLEEPSPKTLYLLLTDSPDSILPTIISRSQRIDLPLSEGVLEDGDFEDVGEAFANRDGKALAEIFKRLKEDKSEDSAFIRKRFYRTLMSFVRKLMLGGKIPVYKAFRNIEAVEDAYRQSERSINDEAVLCFMMDRITFP